MTLDLINKYKLIITYKTSSAWQNVDILVYPYFRFRIINRIIILPLQVFILSTMKKKTIIIIILTPPLEELSQFSFIVFDIINYSYKTIKKFMLWKFQPRAQKTWDSLFDLTFEINCSDPERSWEREKKIWAIYLIINILLQSKNNGQ